MTPRPPPPGLASLAKAYADYEDMMALTEELVSGAALQTLGSTQVTYQGVKIDLTPPWRRATMSDLVKDATGDPRRHTHTHPVPRFTETTQNNSVSKTSVLRTVLLWG